MRNAHYASWGSLVAAIVLMVGMMVSLVGIHPVSAARTPVDNVNIRIHKKKMLDSTIGIDNEGKEVNVPGEPLADAGFTVYNITKQFYAEYNGKNGQEIADKYTADINAANDYVSGQVGSEIRTDADGNATWSLPAKTALANGTTVDSVYAILETTVPGTVTSGSMPMIVALPAKDTNGHKLTDIHLYPKNYGIDKVLLDEDGKAATDTQRMAVGSSFSYQATFTIPQNIADMKAFDIKDAIQGTGVAYDDITGISVAGQSDDNYLKDFTDHAAFTMNDKKTSWDYKFNLADPTAMAFYASLAGKTVTVRYTAHVNADATPDVAIGNKFYVNYTTKNDVTHDLDDDSTEVETGGHKFVKVSSTTGATLKGATFVVQNSDKQFAKFDGSNPIKWVDDANDATTFTSDEGGQIAVKGLADGNYKLVEQSAPDGYEIIDKETPFEIKHGSFDKESTITVKNKPDSFGFLPMTGGMGWLAFILVGLGLVGVAFFMQRRRGQQA